MLVYPVRPVGNVRLQSGQREEVSQPPDLEGTLARPPGVSGTSASVGFTHQPGNISQRRRTVQSVPSSLASEMAQAPEHPWTPVARSVRRRCNRRNAVQELAILDRHVVRRQDPRPADEPPFQAIALRQAGDELKKIPRGRLDSMMPPLLPRWCSGSRRRPPFHFMKWH